MEVAKNNYDNELFICLQSSRLEREGDEGTAGPDEEPEATRGHNFQPLFLEDREPILYIPPAAAARAS
ncbi:hypothetical protein NW759_017244 [Fusarium solani]|nr:hypothetical protein NW759_017244 [Fusarium solani]